MNYWDFEAASIADLLGKTITAIDREGDEKLTFHAGSETWAMQHHQDCCESVEIAEVIGDLNDLVNDGPVLLAEEASEEGEGNDYESSTWTFYKIRTFNGDVTIRWLGTSNGYYSESVSFDKYPATPE